MNYSVQFKNNNLRKIGFLTRTFEMFRIGDRKSLSTH